MLLLVITVVIHASPILRVITYAGSKADPAVVTNVPTFPSTLNV